MSRAPAALVVVALLSGAGCASVPGAAAATGTASSCDELAAAYATALVEVQVCDPAAADACGAVRARRLEDPCHCTASVTPSGVPRLDALSARWTSQACPVQGFCNRACRAPSRACVVTSDSAARCDGG